MESGPQDDSKATTSTSLAVPASSSPAYQDMLVYNFLNNLSPLQLDKGMSNLSPTFASPLMHLKPDDVLIRLESAVGVEVYGDHRADTNFLKEDNPVGLSDIISTSFNSQQDKSLNPQYDCNFIKEMVLEDDPEKPSNIVQQRLPKVSQDKSESALPTNFSNYASENFDNLMGNDDKVFPYSRIQNHEQCAAELQSLGYGAHRRLQFEAGRSQSSWTQTHEINAPLYNSLMALTNLNDMVAPGFHRTRFIGSETVNSADFVQGQVPNSFAISANNSVDSVGTKVDLQEELSKGPINLHNAGKDVQIDDVSMMRKRKKSITTQGQDCKHCNCKRSKCVKLYCDCFSAGKLCSDSCACQNCYNKLDCEDIVVDTRQLIQTRNPIAFSPKVVRNTVPNVGEQENFAAVSSARHKKGCNCKRSKCLKNYCECFQSKVGCFFGCRCENCQNSFGIKTENARSEKWEKLPHERPYTAEGITHGMNTVNANKFFARNVLADISNLSPLSHSWVCPTASSNSSILGDWRGYTRDQIQVPVTQVFMRDAAFGRRSPLVSLMGKNDENYPPCAPSEVMTHMPGDNHNPSKGIPFGSDDGDWSTATSSFGLRSCQKLSRPPVPSLTAPVKPEDKTNQSSNEDQNI